jgi:methionine synthase II (cobalamin-independent)
MPGPFSVGMNLYRKGVTDQFYNSRAEFIEEIAAMLRDEIEGVIADGASYVQLDSLHYVERITYDVIRERMIEEGEDPEAYLDSLIAADNSVLSRAWQGSHHRSAHVPRQQQERLARGGELRRDSGEGVQPA